ncbi:hypothetical protein [Natrialba chahannaoensis]|uniref:hypothetical protein n=1 Tax=Natrialba chahannaoensis TaxID=68911 RepID=UPI001268D359|nr:hypothetical protein [Natrialba chahannaoensis]
MPMDNGYDRRKVLKTITTGSIAGVALTGMASADDTEDRSESEAYAEATVTSDDIGGDASITTEDPHSGPGILTGGGMEPTDTVDHVATFSSTLDLESSAGVDYGYAQGHATMYRAHEQVSDEYVYFIWHHMTGYPDDGYFYKVRLREMEVSIDVVDDDVTLVSYDPTSSQLQREREYDLSADVTLPSGAGAGLSGSNYVHQGTVHPVNQSTGQSGSFGVEYENDNTSETSFSMNGISEYRSEEKFTDDTPWRGDYFSVTLYASADGHG